MDILYLLLDVGGLTKSPFQRRKAKNTILLKKQVKFTDDLKCCSDVLTTAVPEQQQNGDIKTIVSESFKGNKNFLLTT